MLLTIGTLKAQLPDFIQTDCNGVEHHLYDDLSAGKAVILNFAAGWCGPCRGSDPLLEVVYKDFSSGKCNVNVYGFIFDSNTPGEATDCAFSTEYAQRAGMTFPVFANIGSFGSGLVGSYFSKYNIEAIPAFFIILPNAADPANSEVKIINEVSENLVQRIKDSLALGGFIAPAITVAGELCSNLPYSAQLTSNFSAGNLWSTTETSQSITVNTSGTYMLTHGGNCSASKYIEFNPLPVVGAVSISTNSICQGGMYTLDYAVPAGGTSNATWEYLDANDTWQEFAPADAGQLVLSADFPLAPIMRFRVRVNSGTGTDGYPPNCTIYSNEVSLAINDGQPGASLGVAASSLSHLCTRAPYTLMYSGNEANAVWQYFDPTNQYWVNYARADQGPVDVDPTITILNGGAQDMWRVFIAGNTCYDVSNTVLISYTAPVPVITPGCDNTLEVTNVDPALCTFLWSPGGQTTRSIPNAQENVQYSVQVTTQEGCTATVQRTFAFLPVKAKPVIVSDASGPVCQGTPVKLSFAGTLSVPPCTNASNGQFPADAITLTENNGQVVITESALAAQYSLINVTQGVLYEFASINSNTEFDLTNDNVTITGIDGTTIYATGKGYADWFAGFTGQVRFYTNEAGCGSNSNTTRIKMAVGLTNWSEFNIFSWQPGGETSPSIIVYPTETTTYSLTYFDATGCSATVSTQVNVAGMHQYYVDADKDGFGSTQTEMVCSSTAPVGYSINNIDCNDNDAAIHSPVQYYVDTDKDGYGSKTTAMLCSLTAPTGYSTNNTDCNDNDAAVFAPIRYYVDSDKDGFGSTVTAMLCSSTAPVGYSTNNTDCNDKNAAVHAPVQYYVDSDKDGFGSTATAMLCSATAPAGYSTNNLDCNDRNAGVRGPTTYYVDADKDGFGSTTTAVLCSSTAPSGYSKNNTDCNDNNASIHEPKRYYIDADKDGFGSNASAMLCSSTAPVGYSINNKDCNDNDAAIHEPKRYYVDTDRDGFGSNTSAMICASTAPAGYASNNDDCNDHDATMHSPKTFYLDADRDGYGNPYISIAVCLSTPPLLFVSNNTDCNDLKANVHPGAVEICGNGIDDNCNGQVDENCCANAGSTSVTNITSGSAQLNWTATVNPVQWQVQYKTTNGSKWLDVPVLPGTARSTVVSNLSTKQDYYWHIRALCANTWTSYSGNVTFKTTNRSTSATQGNSTLSFETSKGVRETLSTERISLRPNPASGRFIVELNMAERITANAKIELVDVTGRAVYAEGTVINNGRLQRTITPPTTLAKGIYVVRIIVNDKMYTVKLLYQE